MPKFLVTAKRLITEQIEVEAIDESDAEDIAWASDGWKAVESKTVEKESAKLLEKEKENEN